MKTKKKCIVMFSGGLDSRLAVKIMQEQGFEVLAVFFKLPFGTGCCDQNCSFNFSQMQGVELKIFDCTKGKLLQEYLDIIKKNKYGTGVGLNPCIDCRIFMFKKAKGLADKIRIDLIVSGEVLGERPMSQMKKSMNAIEKECQLEGRLLRPLSAKLLPETNAEKKGLVNREKLYDIEGRRRVKQIELANKFKINYPTPAGGCLLCEKDLKTRFLNLLKRGLNEKEILLVGIGRHFIIDDSWIILGRDENENKIIEKADTGELIIPDFAGPSALVLFPPNVSPPSHPIKEKIIKEVNKLILAYSKQGSLEDRKKFEKWKV